MSNFFPLPVRVDPIWEGLLHAGKKIGKDFIQERKKKVTKVVPLLKVGSCRFEGIIILLIHFLNCQKALFTKKLASFSKKYRVKSIR